MEGRAFLETRRVDSLGDGHRFCFHDDSGNYCFRIASEREGKLSFGRLLCGIYINPFPQREDELERRRISHHINFDAL